MTMPFDQASDAPDEALLVLYANGDPAAARELAARHLPRVMGFAARMLGGDRAEAEDVAQEAMLRLWRIAPDWRQGEAKVSTWLYRVVTTCAPTGCVAENVAVPWAWMMRRMWQMMPEVLRRRWWKMTG
jgi:hypothetical protein